MTRSIVLFVLTGQMSRSTVLFVLLGPMSRSTVLFVLPARLNRSTMSRPAENPDYFDYDDRGDFDNYSDVYGFIELVDYELYHDPWAG